MDPLSLCNQWIQVMSQIVVTKKNESLLYLSTEEAIAAEISDYFSFFTPGYQYQPLFKSGIWDGKIRLFDRRFSTLPYGLLSYLNKFSQDRAYSLIIDESVLLTTNFSINEAEEFSKTLNLPVVPYPHQIEAFTKAIRYKRSLILSPTSSGKSLLIYLIIRFLQQNHKKGLVIVPTTSLVEQLYKDFETYGYNSAQHVHRIYAGKEKITKHFVTISTWQSLYLQSPEYLSQFDFVIGDEAHQFKAKSLTQLMNGLVNADVRIGTTGTLDGTKTHKLVLEGHFGPVFQPTTTRKLMDEGVISPLKIKALVLKYPESFSKLHRGDDYKEEYDAVITNPARTKFIRNLAISVPGNTLVLFQLVDKHGKKLHEEISEHAKDHQVFYVHGGVETEDRERIRELVEKSNNSIIIASYGTFSTGINIKNLHNVIFAAPSKARIRNLQSIGRGLRKAQGKEHAVLFDIVDDLRIGKHTNFLLKHYEQRTIIYAEEKLSLKQYFIDLNE